MKTVVFANSSWAMPLIHELFKMNHLSGIVIPSIGHSENDFISQFALQNKISLIKVNKDQLKFELKEWLNEINPEVAFCMTFPYLIPETLLSIPKKGVINFHFGKLPEFAGADPLFWYLKEGKRTATITVHRMGCSFDSGQLIIERDIPIMPGENWGLLGARLSEASASLIPQIFSRIYNQADDFREITKSTSQKSVGLENLQIDWAKQTADEIESLVNACNPKYGGAITYFRGSEIHILEVSPADLSNVNSFSPGSIVVSDIQNGIFVLCSDFHFLRINVFRTPEAYVTGHKLAALGVNPNERFYTSKHSQESPKTESSLLL